VFLQQLYPLFLHNLNSQCPLTQKLLIIQSINCDQQFKNVYLYDNLQISSRNIIILNRMCFSSFLNIGSLSHQCYISSTKETYFSANNRKVEFGPFSFALENLRSPSKRRDCQSIPRYNNLRA